MFDSILGFFKVIPLGYYIALVCLILLASIIWMLFKRQKGKKGSNESKKKEDIVVEEESIAVPKEPELKDAELPMVSETGNKKDVPSQTEKVGVALNIGYNYKYPAVIKWYPKPGRTPIIEFGNKIDRPLGGLYTCEPSCPITGDAYFIIQNADGSFSPYEPRGDAILSDKTPYMAFEATHWEEAEEVWRTKEKSWFGGKVGTMLTFGICAMCFILVLVRIGS